MKHEKILETYVNAASSITTGTYVVTQAGVDRLLNDIESLPRDEVLADLNEAMEFVSKKERAVIGALIEKLNRWSDMNSTIKFDSAANLYAVIGTYNYALECFNTEKQAADYLAEFEEKMPKTAGEVSDLAAKHGALFRNI